MISTLAIRHFKSIKDLTISCRRVNVFIGEPNVGKSNILETLAFVSYAHYGRLGGDINDFLRFEHIGNLFWDGDLDSPLQIGCDDALFALSFNNNRFEGKFSKGQNTHTYSQGGHDRLSLSGGPAEEFAAQFKFYRFKAQAAFSRPETAFLLPPIGANLQALLLANRDLRNIVNQPFLSRGHRLGIRPQEHKLEAVKQADDVIISFPYSTVSDTFQRVTFYLAAILSNKESVIAFEEPESHAFPYYTKHIAELVALDGRRNQYFISTHNPYFLLPLVAKTPMKDLAVFITYYDDYQTKVKLLSGDEISEFDQVDIFSNLDRFLEKA
ncbi:MAG: AAA family ATPase [Chloroflexi bacterium]|nr:AAA family ATPase [Chloroflexota bacterium]